MVRHHRTRAIPRNFAGWNQRYPSPQVALPRGFKTAPQARRRTTSEIKPTPRRLCIQSRVLEGCALCAFKESGIIVKGDLGGYMALSVCSRP
jgi:hypothetical protein